MNKTAFPLPALPPRGGAAPREGGVPRGARAGVAPWEGRTVPSAPRAGRAVGPGGSRLGRHEAYKVIVFVKWQLWSHDN